jgi:hypothetical protein
MYPYIDNKIIYNACRKTLDIEKEKNQKQLEQLKKDLDDLFEEYEIDYQEEASTKWNDIETRKLFGQLLDTVRELHDRYDSIFEKYKVKIPSPEDLENDMTCSHCKGHIDIVITNKIKLCKNCCEKVKNVDKQS